MAEHASDVLTRGVVGVGGRGEDRRNVPGFVVTEPATASSCYYTADASVPAAGVVIGRGVQALVWQGSAASSIAANATTFDRSATRWTTFTLVGAGGHYIAPSAQIPTIAATNEIVGLNYIIRTTARRWQITTPPCIPFVNNLDPTVTVYAGTLETTTALGDGGPATSASIGFPGALAVGPDGSLYIFPNGVGGVRKVATNGVISTLPLSSFAKNSAGALDPNILGYYIGGGGLLVDGGRLYISSGGLGKVISLKLDGTDERNEVTGLAGPNGLCRGPGNTILISCASNGTVVSWDRTTNIVTRILGDGTTFATKGFGAGNGYKSFAGIGAANATASGVYLTVPGDIVIGPDGTTYISTGQFAIRALVGSAAPEMVFARNEHEDYLESSDVGTAVHLGYAGDCVGTAYGATFGSGKFALLMDPTNHLWFSSCGTLWQTVWYDASHGFQGTSVARAGDAAGGASNPPCRLSDWKMRHTGGFAEQITGFAIGPDGTYYLSSTRSVVYRVGCSGPAKPGILDTSSGQNEFADYQAVFDSGGAMVSVAFTSFHARFTDWKILPFSASVQAIPGGVAGTYSWYANEDGTITQGSGDVLIVTIAIGNRPATWLAGNTFSTDRWKLTDASGVAQEPATFGGTISVISLGAVTVPDGATTGCWAVEPTHLTPKPVSTASLSVTAPAQWANPLTYMRLQYSTNLSISDSHRMDVLWVNGQLVDDGPGFWSENIGGGVVQDTIQNIANHGQTSGFGSGSIVALYTLSPTFVRVATNYL